MITQIILADGLGYQGTLDACVFLLNSTIVACTVCELSTTSLWLNSSVLIMPQTVEDSLKLKNFLNVINK